MLCVKGCPNASSKMFEHGSPTLLGFPIWAIKGSEIGHSFPHLFRAFIEIHTLKVQNLFVRVVTRYNIFWPQIEIPDSQNTTKSDPWHQLKFPDPDPITCNPRYQGDDPRSLIPFYDPVTFNNKCNSYMLQISFCESSWYITLPKVGGTPLCGLYRYVRLQEYGFTAVLVINRVRAL